MFLQDCVVSVWEDNGSELGMGAHLFWARNPGSIISEKQRCLGQAI